MTSYYNEIDSHAAAWLRNLIDAGHIAYGVVDERSIEDVHPSDLEGFTQCHFFAGVGVWSLALRRAGWPDSRPVWTGSCPCQPFSAAGKGTGLDDERHLWPAFHHLIAQRRPAKVIGEQVASKDADPWIDLVCADMEALGYAFGAVPFPSAGVGAPHIRERIYWVANAADQRQHGRWSGEARDGRHAARSKPQRLRDAGWLANAERDRGGREATAAHHGQQEAHGPADRAGGCGGAPGGVGHSQHERLQGRGDTGSGEGVGEARAQPAGAGSDGRLGNTERDGLRSGGREAADLTDQPGDRPLYDGALAIAGATNGLWRDADWLLCRDGKWRPVEPGTFPLAHGAPARVGRLRAYGNAINAEAATEFIRCVKEE